MRVASALAAALSAVLGAGCGSQPIPPDRQPWEDSGNESPDDWGEARAEPAEGAASTGEGDGDADDAPTVAGSEPAGDPPTSANPLEARYGDAPALRTLRGRASYYHDSLAGNHTANGDIYDPEAFTAASRNLPFGTILRVIRRDNDRSVVVRVNDRGPFGSRQRILDLSRAAAEQLDMIRAGVVEIRAEIVHRP